MLDPEALAASTAAAAVAIAKSLSNDETALLGAVFTQLGDTLTTIVQARAFNKNNAPPEGGAS